MLIICFMVIGRNNKMDPRCVCCQMLYERFFNSKIYRLGDISSTDFRPALFRKLSSLLNIEESGNYYFFDSICTSLLGTDNVQEVMQEEKLNIRTEHIIQKTLSLYIQFFNVLNNEIYFISTRFWYKRGHYYAQAADKRVQKFLKLLSKYSSKDKNIYELDIEKVFNEDIKEIWELIK